MALHILRLDEVEFNKLDFLEELLGLVEAVEHGLNPLQVEEGIAYQKGVGFGEGDEVRLIGEEGGDDVIAAFVGLEVFEAEEFRIDLLAGGEVEGAALEHGGAALVDVARRDCFNETTADITEHDPVQAEEAFDGEDRFGL